MPTLYQIIMIALACAFIELTISKTGWRYMLRDWFDIKGLDILTKMLECDFCLGFWLSVLISVVAVLVVHDPAYFLVPVFAAPITRFLI